MSTVIGWVIVQFLKTLINFALNKNLNTGCLVGPGGVPNSHSTTICGLTTAALFKYRAGSFESAVSFVFSMIVMYGAIGVRHRTEKQAKLLNSILSENPLKLNAEVLQERPKEYAGHTPLQVLVGVILRIGLALILNSCY